ncbi:MAG: biotin--[acetyl-CoA-carboxylase] ligase [Phycisphaerales bacterium JB037]
MEPARSEPSPDGLAPSSGQTPIERWGDRLDDLVASMRSRWITRAAVVRETASTQDAAAGMSALRPGWFVVASAQTRGRGRLGRAWTQSGHLGIAATLTVDAGAFDAGSLSLRAGLAACAAVERFVGEGAVGIRWPNDVVARHDGRKIAGVLIEQREGALLVGIGINVLQERGDWPGELAASAASLRQLGHAADRIKVVEALMHAHQVVLDADARACLAEWSQRDVLRGRTARFRSSGVEVRGEVVEIDPACALIVARPTGTIRLDANTTTLLGVD